MNKIKTLTKKDFDWVFFTPQKLEKKLKEEINKKKQIFKEVKKVKAVKRNFENTVFALEKSDREMYKILIKLNVLSNLSPKKQIRKKTTELEVWASRQLVDINFDAGIYKALLEYKDNFFKKEKLEEEDRKLFLEYLKEYKKMGFSLSDIKQQELKKINKRISKISSDFSKNINDWEDFILVNKNETKGLSDNFLKTLKKEKGKYKISLDYPEINPFLEMSESDKKREEILKKASQKGGKKNLEILTELINLKNKKANLLRYKSYPDLVASDRMAKNAKNILNFYEPLLIKMKKIGREELKLLENYKKKITKNKKAKIFPHDIPFLENKLKKEKFNLDQQKLKNHFQLENVKKEMFGIFSKLFHFKIKKNDKVKLWHKDVEFYDVFYGNKKISHFILDLFPRKGKYGHAAMWDLEYGFQEELSKKNRTAPVALIVCNFQKANFKIPSTISHREIETLFHEFGHSLHHILSETKHYSFFGVSVAWDFVETPSQLLENWAWDKDFLKKVSNHWKTGEKLSPIEINNLIESRFFMEKYQKLKQLIMTKIDFELHYKNIKDPAKYWKKIMKKYTKIEVYKESLMPAGFGHIVGGYDAGYYSYLWALVFADDIFSVFEKEGIYNKKIGKKYRKEILAKGGSQDEKKIVRNFLGREPSSNAFLNKIF